MSFKEMLNVISHRSKAFVRAFRIGDYHTILLSTKYFFISPIVFDKAKGAQEKNIRKMQISTSFFYDRK